MAEQKLAGITAPPQVPRAYDADERSEVRWGLALVMLAWCGYAAIRFAEMARGAYFTEVGSIVFDALLAAGVWRGTHCGTSHFSKPARVAAVVCLAMDVAMMRVWERMGDVPEFVSSLYLLGPIPLSVSMACLGICMAKLAAEVGARRMAVQFRVISVCVLPVGICLTIFGCLTAEILRVIDTTGVLPASDGLLMRAHGWMLIPALFGAPVLLGWGHLLMIAFILRLKARPAPGGGG